MYGFPNRLKILREKMGYTQSDVAKKLSLTRASVNAWEMGISSPSIPFWHSDKTESQILLKPRRVNLKKNNNLVIAKVTQG